MKLVLLPHSLTSRIASLMGRIYFDLGNTIAFAEHNDAYTYFNIAGVPAYNSAMSAAAAAQGFDSVQFLAHVDHVSCESAGLDLHGPLVPPLVPRGCDSSLLLLLLLLLLTQWSES